MRPVAGRRAQFHAIGPGFGGLVRRTQLLNLGIFLSILAMAIVGGENTAALAFLLLVTTAILWCVTFAVAPFLWLGQVVFRRKLAAKPQSRRSRVAGVMRDDWLDGM